MARRLARLPLLPTRNAPEPPDGGGSGTPTASAGTPRTSLLHSPRSVARRRQRSQRLLANRAVRDAISMIALVSRPRLSWRATDSFSSTNSTMM